MRTSITAVARLAIAICLVATPALADSDHATAASDYQRHPVAESSVNSVALRVVERKKQEIEQTKKQIDEELREIPRLEKSLADAKYEQKTGIAIGVPLLALGTATAALGFHALTKENSEELARGVSPVFTGGDLQLGGLILIGAGSTADAVAIGALVGSSMDKQEAQGKLDEYKKYLEADSQRLAVEENALRELEAKLESVPGAKR